MGSNHSSLARDLVFSAILLLFFGSQLYWILRARAWGKKLIASRTVRLRVGVVALAAYLGLFAYNFRWFGRSPSPTHLTFKDAALGAPFQWWLFSSLVAFAIVIIIWTVGLLGRMVVWGWQRVARPTPAPNGALAAPARRRFLERAAMLATAAPFAASAYGLLYGRTEIETTTQPIRLARLPKAFHGFRIAQLSDIHIGPFMTESEIRRYVEMANAMKPDLTVVTGDFVTWDPSTQRAAVNVLAGLKAPFGIYGCLGNHEAWSHTEDSITRLFSEVGVRILRHARAPIVVQGESINLIGVDFQTRIHMARKGEHVVRQYLEGVDKLMAPDTANILLSHNPNTFDRAAELGIDLSLAGHTHGGQVTLEFVSPALSPSRLITAYVRGWFEKQGAQLYVNRGIGTIGIPIRIDAPPEITLFELTRNS
ncbi:MAG TPA: metallophosphoesterase [Terriglobia bacterium]|nr:metallophosphoesterase [Terriglobia bacterium]